MRNRAEGPTDEGPTDKGPTDEGPTDEGPTDERPTDKGQTLETLLCIVYHVSSITLSSLKFIIEQYGQTFGQRRPPLTKLIKSILDRYPDGAQILKVYTKTHYNLLSKI